LTTLVLLNFFVEIIILQDSPMKKLYIILSVTFDQFNASSLNKGINFFKN